MEPSTVETQVHGKFNIALQECILRGGVNPIRVESLIQDHTHINRFAVDFQGTIRKGYVPKTEIAFHPVDHSAIPQKFQSQVVKLWSSRIPQVNFLHRQPGGGFVPHHHGFGFAHGFSPMARFQAYPIPGFCPYQIDGGVQRPIGGVGFHFCGGHVAFSHKLHPHRLPNTGGTGVAAGVGFVFLTLLAGGLLAGTLIVPGVDHDGVIPHSEGLGYVELKGGIAAPMGTAEDAIHPYLRLIIHRTEVEDGVSPGKPVQNDVLFVPHRWDKIGIANTRKLAFGTEGYHDGQGVIVPRHHSTGFAADTEIKGKVPRAIQTKPVFPYPLGAGVVCPGHTRSYHNAFSLSYFAGDPPGFFHSAGQIHDWGIQKAGKNEDQVAGQHDPHQFFHGIPPTEGHGGEDHRVDHL